MLDKNYLLDDKQMRDFIINGYVTVQTDFAPDFHESIYRKAEGVFEKEGNPGNNIMARVPELHQVFNHPVVRGVLTSTLGPSYIMHPHRHCHFNPPGSEGQAFHQDSYEADENVRHHRSRWAMVFYYPQDVTEDIGPTAILPATQYYNTRTGAHSQSELPLCGKAGTVTIVHYDLWHRAMANRSDSKRFMMKFLFCRMEEPQAPSWNADAPGGLSFDNGSSALQHQVMWRHLWDWMSGKQGNGVKAANPSSNSDVPKWIKAMRAGDEAARCDAADALGVMGESAQDTVPALIEALQDESEAVRLNAAYALGAIGEPAVPALISALHKEAEKSLEQNLDRSHANPSQLYSVYALSAVGQPAVPTLIDILSDENWWVRAPAATLWGILGPLQKWRCRR
ncbi:MAG: HEAT repeat domain-containing protein [Candidatus Poribacteria bacterium]|nr:HEAT repeat domain-containing protein [Candidatus Poribacteria bacterium]